MADLPFDEFSFLPDEFSFLPDQAAELGLDRVPPVRRRTIPVTGTLAGRTSTLAGTTGTLAGIGGTLAGIGGTLVGRGGRTVSALEYGDPGTGEFGEPEVTFLHGAGLNAHTWDTTVLALGIPALAIDLPGHGDSTWRDDARYTARTLAPDVAAAIAACTTRPQVLVGQSLGGLTAAAIAAAHPELVRSLVIVDITPGIDPNGRAALLRAFYAGPSDWASRDELVDRALSFGLGGTRAAATRGVFLNSRVRADGRVEWKHHFAQLANAASRAASAGAATRADHPVASALDESGWDDLAAVRVPVTLIRGDRGYVGDEAAAEFAQRVPAASVRTVGSGHNVQEELPVALARMIAAAPGNE